MDINDNTDGTKMDKCDERKCNEVSKRANDKGKHVMNEIPIKHVCCKNGFGTLRVWNDPTMDPMKDT